MPDHWHRWRDEDGAWIEARHWNVRWDLAVQTTLPRLRDTRLARAVRQELWRELRDLRGFRPAVKVALGKTGVTVTAGRAGRCGLPQSVHRSPGCGAAGRPVTACPLDHLVGACMMRGAMVILAALAVGGAGVKPIGDGMGGDGVDTPIPLPSGNDAQLFDVVTTTAGSAGLTYRFRFIAEWIADGADFETVSADMIYLCEAYALPRIAEIGPQPAQVVVSLSDVPVEFGQPSSDAVQYFEAFRPEAGVCVWELF